MNNLLLVLLFSYHIHNIKKKLLKFQQKFIIILKKHVKIEK
jgi:hypothetical protein